MDIASHAGVFRGARISSLPTGREEIRAPLKMPAWEAKVDNTLQDLLTLNSVGCLWHSHSKNPVRLYPKLQTQPIGLRIIFIDYLFFQADQSDCTKSVSNLSPLSFSTCGLGWLVNQRNPSGYWQVTKGDLSQIMILFGVFV